MSARIITRDVSSDWLKQHMLLFIKPRVQRQSQYLYFNGDICQKISIFPSSYSFRRIAAPLTNYWGHVIKCIMVRETLKKIL